MTERPSPERLAEIRDTARKVAAAEGMGWGRTDLGMPWVSAPTALVVAAEALDPLLAEIDALRAERDALRTIARDVAIAEASIASCVIHGAPPEVFREHRAEWQRALAALRGWLAG